MVTFINPFLDDKTRTVKAGVNLNNAEGKLKPAMYATVAIRVRLLADGTPEPTELEGKYVCPMHPEVIRDAPGKCSICEMTLDRVPGKPRPATPPGKHDDHVMHKHPGATAGIKGRVRYWLFPPRRCSTPAGEKRPSGKPGTAPSR
jgi:hypothetical protein